MIRMNRKWLLPLFMIVISCSCFGSEPNNMERYEHFGDIVLVNNKAMHIRIRGKGSPTVIFFSDIDMYGTFINWKEIQDEIGKQTKTVCFDRLGYFWSDEGELPRTGERIALEVEALLAAQGDTGPYLIVGHGMGGIYGRIFAGMNIEKIVGMVFLDPLHPQAFERMKEVGVKKTIPNERIRPLIWLLLKLGIKKESLKQYGIPNDLYRVALTCYKKNSLTWFDETAASVRSLQQAEDYNDFGNIPLHILTSKKAGKIISDREKLWVKLQSELLGLSRNSKQSILEGVGHYIHLERPEIVIESIFEMIENSRRETD
ncbi:alpha/beta fold hydrolase [Sediminispirochaeta bajacaliforniensis]|uniref:alpha/beta fold hydrolase n=1 Tax=Sediminispirochaeta bajacaliforniensis TaxID=148 RepID=UPI00037A3114|nr:alpha/beta hydrolase [Sediminispirochaeta bajacaliforniensis]